MKPRNHVVLAMIQHGQKKHVVHANKKDDDRHRQKQKQALRKELRNISRDDNDRPDVFSPFPFLMSFCTSTQPSTLYTD